MHLDKIIGSYYIGITWECNLEEDVIDINVNVCYLPILFKILHPFSHWLVVQPFTTLLCPLLDRKRVKGECKGCFLPPAVEWWTEGLTHELQPPKLTSSTELLSLWATKLSQQDFHCWSRRRRRRRRSCWLPLEKNHPILASEAWRCWLIRSSWRITSTKIKNWTMVRPSLSYKASHVFPFLRILTSLHQHTHKDVSWVRFVLYVSGRATQTESRTARVHREWRVLLQSIIPSTAFRLVVRGWRKLRRRGRWGNPGFASRRWAR